MYPAFEDSDHLGKNEWSGDIIKADSSHNIQAFWYLSEEEDADSFDWENKVEFEVGETF